MTTQLLLEDMQILQKVIKDLSDPFCLVQLIKSSHLQGLEVRLDFVVPCVDVTLPALRAENSLLMV